VFRLYYVVRRQTPPHKLTLSQGAALSRIVTAGSLRMGELAAAEEVRLPTMTELVARLEREGLARRAPDPQDRRVVLVEATDQGRLLYADLVTAREEFLRERLARLSREDRAAIEAALPALNRMLDLD
jgi:DNA-binding MarR family transcriptional regulator